MTDRTDTYSHEELAQAVQRHARDHYTEDGWDYIVECFGVAELRELFDRPITGRPPTTPDEAIAVAHAHVRLWDEQRRSVQADAW